MPNTAEIVAQTLKEHGVRYVFGLPSGQLLSLLEALRKEGIQFVLVSHEAAAGFMADVWGRCTGTPGVCISTLGPGATNMSTGVGNAFLDRSPVIAITAQDPTDHLQRRVQMRIDHQALFRPITKASFMIPATTASSLIEEAFAIATAEPPGPVHLDLPQDAAAAEAESTQKDPHVNPKPPEPAEPFPLERIAELLSKAERPLVALGLSTLRCCDLTPLRAFIEAHRMPYVTTLMAKGALPTDHPWQAGVVGRARKDLMEKFCRRADLIIGIGYDPVEICYEDWMPRVPLVHIDSEPADVAPSILIAMEMVGNLTESLKALAGIPPQPNSWSEDELIQHREALRAALTPESPRLAPHHVLEALRDVLPREGIFTCDVGAHTHLIGQLWPVHEKGTFLVSNGWSSMGFGVPAAIAAKLAQPERTVVAVVGDGGFRMMAGEMATAHRLNIPVAFVVLSDGTLALIREKQRYKGYAIYGTDISPAGYEPPNHYFGVPVRTVRTVDDLTEAVKEIANLEGPLVIEAIVDPSEYSTMHL